MTTTQQKNSKSLSLVVAKLMKDRQYDEKLADRVFEAARKLQSKKAEIQSKLRWIWSTLDDIERGVTQSQWFLLMKYAEFGASPTQIDIATNLMNVYREQFIAAVADLIPDEKLRQEFLLAVCLELE